MRKSGFLWTVFIFYMCCSYATAYAQPIQKVDSAGVNQLPSIPFLPDPLVLDEGGQYVPITNRAQWQKKRKWIKTQYQYWISGSTPPAPEGVSSRILSDTTKGKVNYQKIELRFGPDNKAKMTMKLMIPTTRERPLPVFMTQWYHRGWARVAVRRGYIGCIYAAADGNDDTKNYTNLYPEYDFATLMRRAWGASRVVDYLHELSYVDTARIALTGHSRNGKQSLMAAAFDERIDAVVSSSGGTGGESTFRYSDDRFTPGSFDRMVKLHDWFSPRLNWFIGQEQKLPVDQNSLMALIAPRGLMMASAITEQEGNPWGIEQSYQSVKRVYNFLEADSALAIWLRRGRHQHATREIEKYLDFFDYIFGRSQIAPKNRLYYNYSFQEWKKKSGEHINPLKFSRANNKLSFGFINSHSLSSWQDSIRQQIRWLLGKRPPDVAAKKQLSPYIDANSNYRIDYLSEVIGKPDLPDSISAMKFGPYTPLGDNLWGTMYFPPDAVRHDSVAKKLPLVIYLHKYAYARGYRTRKAPEIIRTFTKQGYAVLMFDLIGFGTRIQEARHFYDRYPHWSKMGKMVTDVQNIISDARQRMPFIESDNIYLAGYSLGGTVALFTAALDERVQGVAAVSAFSSLRRDNQGTEGIRHYSHMTGLLPRLGFFVEHEDRIPIDFNQILACIAPRPALLIAPERDRNHSIDKVTSTVKAASTLYKQRHVPRRLTFKHPDTYNHFTEAMQQQIATWLTQQKINSASGNE